MLVLHTKTDVRETNEIETRTKRMTTFIQSIFQFLTFIMFYLFILLTDKMCYIFKVNSG
jgi:hypothetical protein